MTENEKEKIENWIASHREELLADLIALVNIPSISNANPASEPPFGEGCQAALQWMLDRGRDFGLKSTNYDNYAGSLSLDGAEAEHPERVMAIWCHLDVVPVGEGWTTPPFEAYYHDGLVTGRGAQDNKCAAIMGLYCLRAIKELEIQFENPVALYFGIDEEVGMGDLDMFLKKYQAPGLSLVADCGFPVCYGEKGVATVSFRTKPLKGLQIKELKAGIAHNIIPDEASAVIEVCGEEEVLHAAGKAGHTAFPKGSENAIAGLLEKMISAAKVDEVKNHASSGEPGAANASGGRLALGEPNTAGVFCREIWGEPMAVDASDFKTLANLARLAHCTDGAEAGIAKADAAYGDLTCCLSVLALEEGALRATLDIRYPISVDGEKMMEKLQEYAAAHGLTMQQESNLNPFGFEREDPLIQTLTQVYNRETGDDAKPFTMAGATYAGKLPNAIPYGISFPGKKLIRDFYPEGHGDYHQPDESVEFEGILRALKIYLVALKEIDALR